MTRRLWQELGGTLFEEYVAVTPSSNRGIRRLDGLVVLEASHRIAERGEVPDLSGRDVVVIQAKASRLGMNVLGQALFSRELMSDAGARRVRTVALCTADDEVLRPLAEQHGIEVVIDAGDGPRWVAAASDGADVKDRSGADA
jgi:hypothetical protein